MPEGMAKRPQISCAVPGLPPQSRFRRQIIQLFDLAASSAHGSGIFHSIGLLQKVKPLFCQSGESLDKSENMCKKACFISNFS
jgi:hypothetical protein